MHSIAYRLMKRRAALLSAPIVAALFAGAVDARTLVVNANGYSIDAKGNVERFQSVLIGDDGRFLSVNAKDDKEPKLERGDYRFDAGGRTMLPGLIESHGHLMGLGLSLRLLDLSATESLDDAVGQTRAYAARNPTLRWIVGRGWNQERWGLGRFPSAADLDRAEREKPVWLERVDGHAGWANSAALKAAGITAATKDPAGGRIERDAAGNPTGVLIDAAMELMPAPPASAGERELALIAALQHLAKLGVTSFADMGTTASDWALFRAFGDDGRLTIRILSYAGGMESMEAISPLRPTKWLYDGKLRLVGIKLYTDGALGSRGAWLKQPYSDSASHGLQILDDTKIRNLFSRANYLGFQIAVHAIGDAAVAQALDAFDEIRPAYGGKYRNRIEHAQIVDPVDVPRFAALETIASVQPTHATSDRSMAIERLGPERVANAYAWQTLLKAGATMTLGSDTPVESANPFLGIHAAVTRTDPSGQPPGGWVPEQALTTAQAIAGFTRWGAWAGHMEEDVGAIEKGRLADFILTDRDPFTVAPAELKDIVVLETWLAGRRVYQKK